MDALLAHIDAEKTETEFGPPNKGTSRVILLCPSCLLTHRTTKRCFFRTFSKFGNYLCPKCRRTDPSFVSGKSIRSKKLWESDEYRASQLCSSKKYWALPGSREARSKASIILWGDQTYASKRAVSLRSVMESPEYMNAYSNAMIELLDDGSFALSQSNRMKKMWSNDSYRKRISDSVKNKWEQDYGVLMRCLMSGDGFRSMKRATANLLWSDPIYRACQSEALRQLWTRDEYRSKIVKASRAQWDDPSFRDRFAAIRASSLASGRRSMPEIVTARILDSLAIRWEEQKAIGPYVFDFFLPDHRILIEVQGEYWHSLPRAKHNDASKFSYVSASHPDHHVFYLDERDYLNPHGVRQKILGFIHGDAASVLEDFSMRDVMVRLITRESSPSSKFRLAEDFLNSFHYGRYGRSAFVSVGAFLGDNLLAVAKFSTPVRKEVATSMGMKYSSVLELDRFCIHPSRHKRNFASWFLSRSSALAFSARKTEAIVSFADTTFDHTGVIYKAAGWALHSVVKPDYYYVNSDGWIMHKKTLYSHASRMGQKESEYAVKHGYVKVFGKQKMKYVLLGPPDAV